MERVWKDIIFSVVDVATALVAIATGFYSLATNFSHLLYYYLIFYPSTECSECPIADYSSPVNACSL